MVAMAAWRGPMVASAAIVLATAAAMARPATPPDAAIIGERQRLVDAKRAAGLATERAAQLTRDAARERDAAARAHADRAAAAARVAAAEAELVTARARVALAGDLLSAQRARLAAGQAPATRLLAALGLLARRPAIAGIAQPGAIDDLVHLRAVLGTALPSVRARTAALRAELVRTRHLQADRAAAAATLVAGYRELAERQSALAALEAGHQARAVALRHDALTEGDRALAMGERARDIVDQIAGEGGRTITLAELRTLPAPPSPAQSVKTVGGTTPAYRLPVVGRMLTGFGEISSAGIRSRGLTLGVASDAIVRAPAGGTVVYARPFRDYGPVVIIDHGAGWTSLLTGLARLSVGPGTVVAPGTPLGRVGHGEQPAVTVELRRRGRPMDITALL